MLIGEPMPSQYDWRFQIFGFPIRVTWLFWIIAAALGYNQAMSLDENYQRLAPAVEGVSSPGFPILLCVWVAATLLSILVHELGHALAFRYFGIQSEIVLYHMGGLAIPTAGYLYQRGGFRRRLTDGNQIIISAAGPLLQLASGIVVGVGALLAGIYTGEIGSWLKWFGADASWFAGAQIPENAFTYALINFYVLISLWWPLFNLLPVYPLDGGHIVQHTIAIVRRTDGLYEANLIGAVVGFGVAWWFFRSGMTINALLFVSLAMSNVQAMQQQGPRIW
jgi:Zn-dependent protease